MKHKVSELEGALLDAAVAKALDHRDLQWKNGEWRSRTEDGELSPIAAFSENWAAGGPLIERERIWISDSTDDTWRYWIASLPPHCDVNTGCDTIGEGPTPLVAAMRAFVSAKLGEEVEL